MSKLTFDQRMSVMSFAKHRADYYQHLASLFRSRVKPLDIFRQDAERYQGKARGTLSALWDARFESGGADLRNTWDGCFPDAELLILTLTSDGDSNALSTALQAMARIARTADKVRSEAVATLAMAVFALSLALAALTLLPMFAVGQYKASMDIPVEYWAPVAIRLHDWTVWVKSHAVIAALVMATVVYGVVWSIDNLVGPLRTWLDKYMVPYKTVRELQATQFLLLMTELTRPRGNRMSTLKVSLETIRANSGNAWLQWQIDKALANMQSSGGVTLEFLDVGLLPQEMFWYLRDMEQAQKDMSKAFAMTGEYIEQLLIPRFVKTLNRMRWAVMFVALLGVFGANGWVVAASQSMKTAAIGYFSR